MDGAASNYFPEMICIGLAGDVMLGRLVDGHVLANPVASPGYGWGNTLPLWRQMDLRMVNLECVIATAGEPWVPKTFHFRAGPRAIDVLEAAGIHLVSLANNHVLDFGGQALQECLARLRQSSIRYAGAGETSEEAAAPTVLTGDGITVAVVALTDGEPEWEAMPDRPGVNHVRYDRAGLLAPYLQRVETALARARDAAQLVIVSVHARPNWGPPTAAMRAVARQIIDLGADLYWGHSNHTGQCIERYRDRAILYSCGDIVADYAVDPGEAHAVLGENGRGKTPLGKVLYGFHQADAGTIQFGGRVIQIRSPHDARRLGIGMVFQQFTLIPALTVVENVALFLPHLPAVLNRGVIAKRIEEESARYGLAVDPWAPVWRLSIGEQQKVEILKLLLARSRVLIFD